MAHPYRRYATGFRPPQQPLGRSALLAAILVAHLMLFVLLLGAGYPPFARTATQSLAVFDVVPPVPPRETPAPPLAAVKPTAKPGGRSQSLSVPRPERVDVTPVPAAPPAAAPSQGVASQTGESPAVAVNADEAGNAGTGAGTGLGDGKGDGSGAGPIIVAPSWVVKPTLADMAEFNPLSNYPRQDLSVRVVLTCQVRLNYTVENCRASEERPRGYNVARAALRSTRIFRIYPPRRNGIVIDGALVRIPVTFETLSR